MSERKISDLRRDYEMHRLDEKEARQDPYDQFQVWFEEVEQTNIGEVNAMNLSTCGKDGKVSSRMVLLKSFDHNGFTFYTNFNSHKARQIAENPYACINFFWFTLERQVKIQGSLQKVSGEDADQYFASRPRGSQIAAHVSHYQSGEVASRDELEQRYKELEAEYEGSKIPRPEYWGGYLLVPELFEFWQGRPYRLHDRIEFTLDEKGHWMQRRLSP